MEEFELGPTSRGVSGAEERGVRTRVLLNDPNTDHIYLKVTPNLFTQEKLHLFESMDMYTSLIKCAKFMENGERLHNLSWRILNKSLLKDNDINKSKKRDGVRNLYNVINPAKQSNLLPVASPKTAQPRSQQLRRYNQERSPQNSFSYVSLHQQKDGSLHSTDGSPIRERVAATSSGNRNRAATSLQVQGQMLRKAPVFLPHSFAKGGSEATGSKLNQDPAANYGREKIFYIDKTPSPEPPSTRDLHSPSDPVLKRTPSLFVAGNSNGNLGCAAVASAASAATTTMTATSTIATTTTASSVNSGNTLGRRSTRSLLDTRNQSLFTQKPGGLNDMVHDASTKGQITRHELLLSSEDEESDWDSMSDDSDLYDDDEFEEEEYYEKQWDELMFTKNKHNNSSDESLLSATHDFRNTPDGDVTTSRTGGVEVKKSLLSDLFLHQLPHTSMTTTNNDDQNNSSNSNNSKIPINGNNSLISRKVSVVSRNETSNITVNGAVTPSSFKNTSSYLEQHFSNENAAPTPSTTSHSSVKHGSRGSFSSVISDSTRERYLHESNAPLTAQTILPTALATHMFIPNGIHQQRMIARHSILIPTGPSTTFKTRKESMDIPSKNRNNSFLKTRMELSEEESFSRVYARRI
ncbi:Mks1p Ecym_5386 [Eremothecium cymbalariae DBVPG|uniref:Nitrogen regulatory protein areA GATA-like domain-containing protein n=1 Tax=Eremothecium cymbalariae (strain CBS 270.75 / DBVPG 7215 / KCTC 17166 / NRRL Y-17582) TaxID=931890 RepID=I6NDJ9_ERECY|nr:hypothetical protein Ecym_5386 [Eremothecium cymbalariae DBVPG\